MKKALKISYSMGNVKQTCEDLANNFKNRCLRQTQID